MIVKQIPVGNLDVFSYLVGCEKTNEAVVIDPGGDEDQILFEAEQAGLTIRYIFNTHNHWDHIAGNKHLKERTGALIVMHGLDAAGIPQVDIALDKESTFRVGTISFKILHTPGHTPGGVCFYAQGQLFTGDTLFVGDSGRTDLPLGDRPTLGASIRELVKLPDDTIVWPGHDYGPTTHSTIGWEKRHNVNAKEYGYFVSE